MSYPETDEAGNPILPRGIYAWDGSKFVSLQAESDAYKNLRVKLYHENSPIGSGIIGADAVDLSAARGLLSLSANHLYNGTTWDRRRNNQEVTLLASTTRGSDTNTPDQTNYNHRGLILNLRITARTVGASPLAQLAMYARVEGTAKNIWLSEQFDPDIDLHFAIACPGVAAAITGSYFSGVHAALSIPLPKVWYVCVKYVADITDLTYSLTASLLV